MSGQRAYPQAMTEHEHVTLDESVFHAYQDVADYARRIVAGQSDGKNLRFYVERLDLALDASHAACEIDPGHHAR